VPDEPISGLDISHQVYLQTQELPQPLPEAYGELCKMDILHLAYADVRRDFRDRGIDPLTLEALEADGLASFLEQLLQELETHAYRPMAPSHPEPTGDPLDPESRDAVRDQVVLAALYLVFERAWAPTSPQRSQSGEAVKWICAAIEKGLTRVYADNIEACLGVVDCDRFLAKVTQRIVDPDAVGLLQKILSTRPPSSQRKLLAPFLASIVFDGIERMLRQAKALGRQEGFAHLEYARFEHDLIVLSDPDLRYEWILPAVQKRLREELSEFQFETNPTKTQWVNMARGGKLRLLGYELRATPDSSGKFHVRYKALKKPKHGQSEATPSTPTKKEPCHRRSLAGTSWRWPAYALVAATSAVTILTALLWNRPAKLTEHGFVKRICPRDLATQKTHYVVFVPQSYEYGGTETYPLILYLHDAGERGHDGYRQVQTGLGPAVTGKQYTFPFITLFPQSEKGEWQPASDDLNQALDALAEVKKIFRVDTKRLYLTGVGSGGLGTWHLAAEHPELWAAIAPISAQGYPEKAALMKNIPCWCFQAQAEYFTDRVERARAMIQALKDAGGAPRYTEMAGVGPFHNMVFDRVYESPKIFEWLLEHRLH